MSLDLMKLAGKGGIIRHFVADPFSCFFQDSRFYPKRHLFKRR